MNKKAFSWFRRIEHFIYHIILYITRKMLINLKIYIYNYEDSGVEQILLINEFIREG